LQGGAQIGNPKAAPEIIEKVAENVKKASAGENDLEPGKKRARDSPPPGKKEALKLEKVNKKGKYDAGEVEIKVEPPNEAKEEVKSPEEDKKKAAPQKRARRI
jgi:hypothetical protein